METERVRRLSAWEKVGYGAGSLGNNLFFTLIPGILGLLALIPLFFYPLSEDRFREIIGNLKERGLHKVRGLENGGHQRSTKGDDIDKEDDTDA